MDTMPRNRAIHAEEVRAYVLDQLENRSEGLAGSVADEFGVTRATAHSYLRDLLDQGVIRREGRGDYRPVFDEWVFIHEARTIEEDVIWNEEIAPIFEGFRTNVVDIWRYGTTEMVNNVIDHSGSDLMRVHVIKWPNSAEIRIQDFGIGIFEKIADSLGLEDNRHAVLELSKGKVTTDPERHTGEGIFFSSRAFDRFDILSGDVFFSHEVDSEEDWILGPESIEESHPDGTSVHMVMADDSDRTLGGVFDEYATDTEDYRFDRTVVPVRLMQYGDDALVSRSQAKRLMTRFDRFRTVVLDFEGVPSIGQAFADEAFRVFSSQHSNVEIVPINANEQVSRMINRARGTK